MADLKAPYIGKTGTVALDAGPSIVAHMTVNGLASVLFILSLYGVG